VLLVYAFLLFLLEEVYHDLVTRLLRYTCHRTGKRCREARVPLLRNPFCIGWACQRPTYTKWVLKGEGRLRRKVLEDCSGSLYCRVRHLCLPQASCPHDSREIHLWHWHAHIYK
jgi:hypothetical protein